MDRDPAIAAVPDRRPDDRCPPHGVAHPVEVEAVLAELASLAQVTQIDRQIEGEPAEWR